MDSTSNTRQNFTFRYALDVLRTLWRGARGVRGGIVLTAVAGVLRVAASLTFVWTTKVLIDVATGRSDASWTLFVCLMIGSLVAQLLLSAVAGRTEAGSQTRLSNRLRSRLFAHTMRTRWTGREHFHSAETVNRLVADVGTAAQFTASTIPGAAVTGLQLVAAFVFMLWLDWRMALAVVVIMPVALLASRLYAGRSHSLTREIRDAETGLQRYLQEDLQHRVVISTLGRTDDVNRGFAGLQNRFFSLVIKRNDLSIFAGSMVSAGFMGGYVLAFLWCAAGLRSGAMTFGTMTAFLQLVSQVQRPVVDLAKRFPQLIQASVASERMQEILDLPEEESGPDEILGRPAGIRFDNVTFTYPDAAESTVTDFSHDFRPGSVTAIAGPTGAGKTTLLMLMLGLLRPDSGTVTLYDSVLGVEAGPLSRGNIVFVPQGNSLLSGTIRTNLQMGRADATDAEMFAALDAAAAGFVRELPDGLDTPCGERGTGLSEGQAQRIAIARGLLRGGGIMILDEPTSALDPATETALLRTMRPDAAVPSDTAGKTRLFPKTIIIVTHHPAVLPFCDEVVKVNG